MRRIDFYMFLIVFVLLFATGLMSWIKMNQWQYFPPGDGQAAFRVDRWNNHMEGIGAGTPDWKRVGEGPTRH